MKGYAFLRMQKESERDHHLPGCKAVDVKREFEARFSFSSGPIF